MQPKEGWSAMYDSVTNTPRTTPSVASMKARIGVAVRTGANPATIEALRREMAVAIAERDLRVLADAHDLTAADRAVLVSAIGGTSS
jgi:hypothetical protein